MIIGALTVVYILILVWSVMRDGNLAAMGDAALGAAGVGLAVAAAVELAYTLFTDGPDEAVNPLLLGISAYALIEVSRGFDLTPAKAGALCLLVVAIALLFEVDRRYDTKREARAAQGAASKENSTGPERSDALQPSTASDGIVDPDAHGQGLQLPALRPPAEISSTRPWWRWLHSAWWRQARDALIDAWAQTPPMLRVVCQVLPLLGCASLILGLVGDSMGFWDQRGFASNLAAGLTGALFGIPVALLIISRLADAQADLAERRDAYRFAHRILHALHEAAVSLLQADRRADAVRHARAVEDGILVAKDTLPTESDLRRALIEDLETAGFRDPSWTGHDPWEKVRDALNAAFDDKQQAKVGVLSVTALPRTHAIVHAVHHDLEAALRLWLDTYGSSEADRQVWAQIEHEWESLHRDVRLRFLELGLPWLDATTAAKLEALTSPPEVFTFVPGGAWFGNTARMDLSSFTDEPSSRAVLHGGLVIWNSLRLAAKDRYEGLYTQFEYTFKVGLAYAIHVRQLLELARGLLIAFDASPATRTRIPPSISLERRS